MGRRRAPVVCGAVGGGKEPGAMEIPHFDKASDGTVVLVVATALMAVGAVMVLSSEARLDESLLELSPRLMPALRQAAIAGIGFGLMALMRLVPYRAFAWRPGREFQPALLLMLITGALLLLVYVPGVGIVRNGARRWISLGGLAFQPSELAKLALVVFLAESPAASASASTSTCPKSRRPTLTIRFHSTFVTSSAAR